MTRAPVLFTTLLVLAGPAVAQPAPGGDKRIAEMDAAGIDMQIVSALWWVTRSANPPYNLNSFSALPWAIRKR
jgi:hypothetical protein